MSIWHASLYPIVLRFQGAFDSRDDLPSSARCPTDVPIERRIGSGAGAKFLPTWGAISGGRHGPEVRLDGFHVERREDQHAD